MKRGFVGLAVLLPLLLGMYILSQEFAEIQFSQPTIVSLVEDSGSITIHFCPQEQCEEEILSFLDSAQETIHCALYDISLPSIKEKLKQKGQELEVQIVTDNEYYHKFPAPFVKQDSHGLMHNKFCIIDQKKVFTGSMNPTKNGVSKNNNNILLIESTVLAQNYEDEFQELWNETFKKGEQVKNPKIKIDNTIIETYFCPEDNCAHKIKTELEKAQQAIYFMTFSFTHEGIANILLLKQLDGLNIQGIMEARQISQYSQFKRLERNGIHVIKDTNPQTMHHKVFIIDDKIVITGSMNPTANGDRRNDENILIIRDSEIAGQYRQEFNSLYQQFIINSKPDASRNNT